MKASKFNKRAGKWTPIIRIAKGNRSSNPYYIKKVSGIVHVMGYPYVFWMAVPDISYVSLRVWLEAKASK